ncbi:hypothetical protein FHS14_003373 [Paenibacillus baekrokdamisoli]|nr:hypothetical protein [Paenibacillus baekrokdamisoli]
MKWVSIVEMLYTETTIRHYIVLQFLSEFNIMKQGTG